MTIKRKFGNNEIINFKNNFTIILVLQSFL